MMMKDSYLWATTRVAVEAIGTLLQLKTRFCLDLFENFVVPSFRWNYSAFPHRYDG